jgi:hypothetical protein
MIWIGTDDGLIQMTMDDCRTWTNVTPPAVNAWSRVTTIEASHFDANTAYAAINTFRLDDPVASTARGTAASRGPTSPAAFPTAASSTSCARTPNGAACCLPVEQAIVSFDDGEHWQSLRNNMPATSVRDLVIKDDDLVVGTHGRSFYILDDITPLRRGPAAVATADALVAPRSDSFRWNTNTDTPLPPDEPAGKPA